MAMGKCCHKPGYSQRKQVTSFSVISGVMKFSLTLLPTGRNVLNRGCEESAVGSGNKGG